MSKLLDSNKVVSVLGSIFGSYIPNMLDHIRDSTVEPSGFPLPFVSDFNEKALAEEVAIFREWLMATRAGWTARSKWKYHKIPDDVYKEVPPPIVWLTSAWEKGGVTILDAAALPQRNDALRRITKIRHRIYEESKRSPRGKVPRKGSDTTRQKILPERPE
jgi:hypothetical protein